MLGAFNLGFYFAAGVAGFLLCAIAGATLFCAAVAWLRQLANQAAQDRPPVPRTANRKPPQGGSGTAPPECRRPPLGWACSRGEGHDGPCAARPTGPQPGGSPSVPMVAPPGRGYHDKA